jgi:hypothetical protein
MNKNYLIFAFIALLFAYESNAQKTAANTGIDGDVVSNLQEYPTSMSTSGIDDWFYGTGGSGSALIDTTNASTLKSFFQGGSSNAYNLSFSMGSAFPLWKTVNGHIYISGGYQRDNVGATDSTMFTSGAKNGENMANMATTVSSFGGGGNKSDIIDVFTAFRRDGDTVTDDLWLLGGVAIMGTSGTRFFDFDYNQTQVGYNGTNFTNVGPDSGHTAWEFDNTGEITQVGDLILACEFDNTGLVNADLRLWVRRSAFNSITPSTFGWGANFDGESNTSTFGFATVDTTGNSVEILSQINSGTVAGPPWGSKTSGNAYTANYTTNQLLEFGINLSSFGVDPKDLPQFSNPCEPIYNSFVVKTRSSASFTSALKDFTQPITFDIPELSDVALPADTTMVCTDIQGNGDFLIKATSEAAKLYDNPIWEWTAISGTITSIDQKQDSIYVDGAGTYAVTLKKFAGCPDDVSDTIVVSVDDGEPIATVLPTLAKITKANGYAVVLTGGDSAASVAATSGTGFGSSLGISWSWEGPNSFTSVQKDIIAVDVGDFYLTVTENRNGCEDIAAALVLPVELLSFDGYYEDGKGHISWSTASEQNSSHFILMRSIDGEDWEPVGQVDASGYSYQVMNYSFVDENPLRGVSYYKLWQVDNDGSIEFSHVIAIQNDDSKFVVDMYPNPLSKGQTINVDAPGASSIQIVNQLGAIMHESDLDYTGKLTLSSNGFVPGMYFVKINSGENTETYSLLILE